MVFFIWTLKWNGGFLNGGAPKSSILVGFFHYKPSILGTPIFGNTQMVTYLSGSFLVVAISPYKSQLSNGIFYVHIIYIHSDVHVAETDAEPCIYIYDICIHCTIQDTLQYTPFKPACGSEETLTEEDTRPNSQRGDPRTRYIYIPRTLVLIGISALSWGVWPSKIGVIGALFFHCQTAESPTSNHGTCLARNAETEARAPSTATDALDFLRPLTMSGSHLKGVPAPLIWLVVEPTHLKNICQIAKIGMKINNVWVATPSNP